MIHILIPGGGRPYVEGDHLDLSQPLAWTVPQLLRADECAELIARIDRLGPTEAPISTAAGFVLRPDVRNNTRVTFDDEALAGELFRRVRAALPELLCERHVVGVNERFRCYRYAPGQQFAAHFDGAYCRSAREASLLTFMVYLNDGFEGGRTSFLEHDCEAVPQTGMALLFQHSLLHEGSVVTSGVKYALRTDVMYGA